MDSNNKLIVAVVIVLSVLTACKPAKVTPVVEPQIANPASVYCEQSGNILEIQTAADGSQTGVCIFADGSTCDEWAYFRGECGQAAQNTLVTESTIEATTDVSGGGPGGGGDNSGGNASGGFMEPGTSEEFSDWWGVIKSTDAGAQYDDYFERQDLGGTIYFGIDSMVPEVKSQIESLRDSNKIVHLYGTLFSNVPDYNGSQVQIDRIEIDE